MPGIAEKFVEDTGEAPTVYISNVELTLSADGRVNGCLAQKVGEISGRAIWYDNYRVVVLPDAPDPNFVEYAASMGRDPRIVVPNGVNTNEICTYDGFGDDEFRDAVGKGAWSESYMGDPRLWAFVEASGGRYGNGDPGTSVDRVNDKANFGFFADGTVETPPGVLAHGTDAISEAVYRQLLETGQVFVRHTRSGGGLGNRKFMLNGQVSNTVDIAAILEGDQPGLWANGSALVEEFVPLIGSPSVTFHSDKGMAYASYQVTHDNDFVGHWSPLPWQIWDPEDIQFIGNRSAKRLGEVGFWGWAGADLGVGPKGERWGFEVNGRTVGSRHAIDIGERLFGVPWQDWSEAGFVVKGIDHFVLRQRANFRRLHRELGRMGCLATPDDPFGVIITIPPAGNVAGIQVNGRNYREVDALYQRVVAEVGDRTANLEDHPLLDNPLMQ